MMFMFLCVYSVITFTVPTLLYYFVIWLYLFLACYSYVIKLLCMVVGCLNGRVENVWNEGISLFIATSNI